MYKQRSVRVRTKNTTAIPLRGTIFTPFLAVARLGSRTSTQEIFPISYGRRRIIECNTVDSINNSRDKLRMKECFSRANIPQARHYHGPMDATAILNHFQITRDDEFALVGKAICGFQGRGMELITSRSELENFCRRHTSQNFFIELYYNYGREYRIHATRDDAFLAWRKLRSHEATERWFFNSHNCNWVGQGNQLFNQPSNWDQLCDVAKRAIETTGLDIGAVDIRVSSKDTTQFIVCEVNSAPALGNEGIRHYQEQIRNVLIKKSQL